MKEECKQTLKEIDREYGWRSWYITGLIDSDDHGPHVVIKVDADDPSRMKIKHSNNLVKVCVVLVRR